MSYINNVRIDTNDYNLAHGRQPKGFDAPYLTLMVILAGIEDGVV